MLLKVEVVQGNDIDAKYADAIDQVAGEVVQELVGWHEQEKTDKKHICTGGTFEITNGPKVYYVGQLTRKTGEVLLDFRGTDVNYAPVTTSFFNES